MILFKIKETAHINSGHVLLSFGSHVMMALTQENVHYTLNSGPGVMSKSNRVNARIQEFLSGGGGGGGGGGRGPTARKQSGQCFFFSHQLILQFTEWIQSFYRFITMGRRGPTSSRGWGCPKKPILFVVFQRGGGPDPLIPLWIRTWGRLTPVFAYRIMVYQNLNKTEKYHPTTTKRKKAISCWSR